MSIVFLTLISDLITDLKNNTRLRAMNTQMPLRLKKKEREIVKKVTPSSIFDFHQELNGLNIEWSIEGEEPDIKGVVKILSLQKILQDWRGVVYFDFTAEQERIRYFHPIDFFIDEACVGAFLNESSQQDVSLYLYNFEGEPTNLDLDITGYIQMLVASKGFLYWQYAVIEILEGQENPVSERFKEWMPKLFPSFSWQEYVQKYNRFKI
ncbi:hypothetical protein H6F89_34170 [Cyanobacteria bacterium FACHB-63]|nr:hypothetical protein [Cyanobacteria bacterium FACHB-63]